MFFYSFLSPPTLCLTSQALSFSPCLISGFYLCFEIYYFSYYLQLDRCTYLARPTTPKHDALVSIASLAITWAHWSRWTRYTPRLPTLFLERKEVLHPLLLCLFCTQTLIYQRFQPILKPANFFSNFPGHFRAERQRKRPNCKAFGQSDRNFCFSQIFRISLVKPFRGGRIFYTASLLVIFKV